MGRAKDAADRIRAEVPIVDVLYGYGYAVHPDGEDREQQFSCDLHGDGADTKPSARVYPDGGSFHCFACGRSRDAITLVRSSLIQPLRRGVPLTTHEQQVILRLCFRRGARRKH